MEVKLTKAEERGVVLKRKEDEKDRLKFALAGFIAWPKNETMDSLASKANAYRQRYEDLLRYDNEGKEGFKQ